MTVLYDHCGPNKLVGPNDIVFDGLGGFYFTDLGKSRARDRDWGGVYYALADGSRITEVVHPILTPNGIGLSPDGKTLYVAETETARLWAFDVLAPGVLAKAPFPSPHGGRLHGWARRISTVRQPRRGRRRKCMRGDAGEWIGQRGGIARWSGATGPNAGYVLYQYLLRRTRSAHCLHDTVGTRQLVAMDWDGPGLRLAHEA